VLDFANYIFTTIFIVEAGLKLVAFGKSYFNNAWNKFDFFVVFSSIIDLLMSFVGPGGGTGILAKAPQLARVLRVLRVTRILRLAGKAEGL
jgi:voltage-dependent calcium channel T type alpha-1I